MDDFDNFLPGCPIKRVFDAIEIFYSVNNSIEFETEINRIRQDFHYKLLDGKIEFVDGDIIIDDPKQDDTLKGIIQQADQLRRNEASLQLAVEKIWKCKK